MRRWVLFAASIFTLLVETSAIGQPKSDLAPGSVFVSWYKPAQTPDDLESWLNRRMGGVELITIALDPDGERFYGFFKNVTPKQPPNPFKVQYILQENVEGEVTALQQGGYRLVSAVTSKVGKDLFYLCFFRREFASPPPVPISPPAPPPSKPPPLPPIPIKSLCTIKGRIEGVDVFRVKSVSLYEAVGGTYGPLVSSAQTKNGFFEFQVNAGDYIVHPNGSIAPKPPDKYGKVAAFEQMEHHFSCEDGKTIERVYKLVWRGEG